MAAAIAIDEMMIGLNMGASSAQQGLSRPSHVLGGALSYSFDRPLATRLSIAGSDG
jgi:hypothetical protein